jgi:hypothetical protein
MTLKEKFAKAEINEFEITWLSENGIVNLEKIADDYAVEFAEWICEKAEVPYIKGTMGNTLEIFKKGKGL